MNAVLLTVLAALGGHSDYIVSDGYHHGGGDYVTGGCHGGHCGGGHHAPHGGWLGMMPQTCYNPRFGCYDGDRYNHRYPAFHGTYYRRPYNYRNVFDYPWHADLHEPTSMFSYNVNEEPGAIVVPAPTRAPVPAPVPMPDNFGAQNRSRTTASASDFQPASYRVIRGLRR
jgi:hypothetical protein